MTVRRVILSLGNRAHGDPGFAPRVCSPGCVSHPRTARAGAAARASSSRSLPCAQAETSSVSEPASALGSSRRERMPSFVNTL
jgi:hypothetical protein